MNRTLSVPFAVVLAVPLAVVWLPDAASAAPTRDRGAGSPASGAPAPLTGEAAAQHCLSMLPDDPDGAADYADDWGARGGGNEAAQCGALAEMATGDPAQAAATLDALSLDNGQPPARQALLAEEAGQAWLSAGQPKQAFDSENRAATLAPSDPGILTLRGRAALDAGNVSGALTDLTASLARMPDQADALVARAEAFRRENQLGKAEADVEAAQRLVPDRPDILLERGVLREATGDRDGARADWNRVLEVAPDSHEADLAQQDLSLLEAGPETR